MKKKSEIKEKGKAGRPFGTILKIDDNEVEQLAAKFWTITEIAAFYKCSSKTISSRFTEIMQRGRESGKAKLRDLQLRSAYDGNITMQIWLGKQYLEQTDKVNVNGLTEEETERLRKIANTEMENNL